MFCFVRNGSGHTQTGECNTVMHVFQLLGPVSMHIPHFRQESNNLVVDASTVFLSIFLKTCFITWVISYPEDRSIILYRITGCRISEYDPDIAESSVCTLSEQV